MFIDCGWCQNNLSHHCSVGNVAGFLTWTTEWRGQPGGDPHLQLWLLPQQPPDFSNHTPAGGGESVRQEVARQGRQRRGEEWKRRGAEGSGEDKNKDKQTKGEDIRGEKQSFQFLGDEKSTMISPVWSKGMIGYLFSCSQNRFYTSE